MVLTCLIALPMGNQELFTELKKLQQLLRYDASKLGPARAFLGFSILYILGFKITLFSYLVFLYQGQKPSFLAIGSPEKYKTFYGSRFWKFSFFLDFLEVLRQKIAIFSKSGHIRIQKSIRNEKFKNLLPQNFLHSSGLPIAKKLGFQL